MLQYNTLDKKTPRNKFVKSIHNWEARIKIYNPIRNNRSLALVTELMDRPYAGWTYLSYGKTQIAASGNVLQYQLTTGIMGPASQAQQMQEAWHRIWGIYRLYGWELQVNNALGINAQAAYYPQIHRSDDHRFHMHGVLQSAVGNTFTHAIVGMLFQTGKLQPAHQSAWWGAAVGKKEKGSAMHESIFFAEPSIMLQAYNATIQGGMFVSDKGKFITPIRGLVGQLRTGMLLSGNRSSFRWYYTFRIKEGARMRRAEAWGSIGLSHRF
ncbi:MAG: lipid A deacylase LpxR family protein [Bacteroidetes bacterium]|nr:lipid A deacylase LpxR family protein [Bacteroidota bacterium]